MDEQERKELDNVEKALAKDNSEEDYDDDDIITEKNKRILFNVFLLIIFIGIGFLLGFFFIKEKAMQESNDFAQYVVVKYCNPAFTNYDQPEFQALNITAENVPILREKYNLT